MKWNLGIVTHRERTSNRLPCFSELALIGDNLETMKERKWKARTKRDLMIEVWEALDCESVGAAELEAIESEVRERFGEGAVESPAAVARLLADEGAELRHPEVLELDVLKRTSDPYADLFKGVIELADLEQAAESIRRLENLRQTFRSVGDKTGVRRVSELAVKTKRQSDTIAGKQSSDEIRRAEMKEIAEWFAVWIRQPEIFETWLELRKASDGFQKAFGVR
jgi:hypothetical protein